MASDLEKVMLSLISVFHKYSEKEGDKNKLSKAELSDLLKKELPGFLEANKDPKEAEKIMGELDLNGDNEVDFQEFAILVVSLTSICNELL